MVNLVRVRAERKGQQWWICDTNNANKKYPIGVGHTADYQERINMLLFCENDVTLPGIGYRLNENVLWLDAL
jgi:hypothetical protein